MTEKPIANSADLDALNAVQALRDAEVAIARSIDLTQRLNEMSAELEAERTTVTRLESELTGAQRSNNELRSSPTFRAASALALPIRFVRRFRR